MSERVRRHIEKRYPVGTLVEMKELFYTGVKPNISIFKRYVGIIVRIEADCVVILTKGMLIERDFNYVKKNSTSIQRPFKKPKPRKIACARAYTRAT